MFTGTSQPEYLHHLLADSENIKSRMNLMFYDAQKEAGQQDVFDNRTLQFKRIAWPSHAHSGSNRAEFVELGIVNFQPIASRMYRALNSTEEYLRLC